MRALCEATANAETFTENSFKKVLTAMPERVEYALPKRRSFLSKVRFRRFFYN